MKWLHRLGWLPVLLPVFVAVAGCGRNQAQPPPPQAPEVKVATPIYQKVTDYEEFPGAVAAVNSIDIRARVSGYLDRVNFTEGTEVKKDSVLFEIDPRTYKADLEQAQAQVNLNEAQLRYADAQYQRNLNLRRTGAVSAEDVEQSLAARDTAAASVRASQATVDRRKLDLAFTKVHSPISGRISSRYIDPGNLVKADDTVLTTIVSLDPIYATFDLDERTTLRLQKLIREGTIKWSEEVGLPVELGLADETGFPREGTINFTDNRVDAGTGTWRLRARFKNADKALSPGMYVRVRMPIGDPKDAMLVAEQALATDQGQRYVYVVVNVDGKSKVEYRPVQVGRVHNGLRVVTGNLKPEEKIIVSGLQRVRPGVEVVPIEKKMEDVIKEQRPGMPNSGAMAKDKDAEKKEQGKKE